MSDAREEIELHPAVFGCIDGLKRDLAASEARYVALRAAAREYLAADEYAAEHDVDDADSGRCTFAEFSGGVDRLKAARSALDALTRDP